MDADTIKLSVTMLAGGMGLVGGALTFINGRLNEAKDAYARNRVVTYTLRAIVSVFYVLGGILGSTINIFLGILCYVFGLAISIGIFVKNDRPADRIEMVFISIECSLVIGFCFFVLSFHFLSEITNQTLNLIEKQTDLLSKMIPGK